MLNISRIYIYGIPNNLFFNSLYSFSSISPSSSHFLYILNIGSIKIVSSGILSNNPLSPSGLGVHFVEGAWGLFLFLVFVGLLLVRGGVHPGWHSPWGRLEMSFLALCCSGRHMDYECIDYECMACHI